MENEYFAYAGLIGIRQGVFASIPWRNVHRTAPLRHGIQLAQVFLFGGCAVASRVHRTGPKKLGIPITDEAGRSGLLPQ